MNRRRPITCRRSDTQILLRGTARHAERVVKPWGTDLSGSLQRAVCAGVSTNLYAYDRLGRLTNEVQEPTGSVPVSLTESNNESRT